MISRKRTFRLLGLIFFAAGIWWLADFLAPPKPKDPDQVSKLIYDYKLTNVKTNKFGTDGKRLYVLKADTLTHFPSRKLSTLEKPLLIQYMKDGRIVETRARTATLADNSKTIEMRDDVLSIQKSRSGIVQARANSERLIIHLN